MRIAPARLRRRLDLMFVIELASYELTFVRRRLLRSREKINGTDSRAGSSDCVFRHLADGA